MKIDSNIRMGKARQGLALGCSLGAIALTTLSLSVQAAVYDVDVSGEDCVLYTDPNYPGRQIRMGGFSGLFPVPGDMTGTLFYTITDRGPTQDVEEVVGAEGGLLKTNVYKMLPCYPMAPMIVKVQLQPDGTAQILERIPLRRQVGDQFYPISGWVNGVELSPEKLKDVYFKALAVDPDALDPEGITMDNNGYFWICEEYRPSMAMVDPDGTVLMRLVPKGCLSGKETVLTYDVLPAVLTKRVNNRGMEGITFAANGCLYGIIQRPLANPTKAVSEASCNLRIVEVNLKPVLQGKPAEVRQLLYRVESANAKVYASDIFALNPAVMVVPERVTDKLFVINIRNATDITPFETEDGKLISDPTKTIEQLDAAGLAALGIKTVMKAAVLPSLTALHKELSKCEGVAVVGNTVVMTYDNDFNLADLGEFVQLTDETGAVVGKMGSIVLKAPDVYPALITAPFTDDFLFGEF